MKQTTFAGQAFQAKKRQTKRERFLGEMDQVVPWERLVAVVAPHYPTTGRRGRPPMPLEMMLRIYFMQQWYALSDEAMEDALYEIESMRVFAGLELIDDAIPDATTLTKFRHRLERHQLTAALFNTINAMLEERGILLQSGTMVDATIIHTAPSTKNREKKRDPDAHQTKKNNQYFFGMKLHVGADVRSGVVHTCAVTAANVADIKIFPDLLREDDPAVFGDSAYQKRKFKRAARAAGVFYGVSLKGSSTYPLTEANKRHNRRLSSIRSRVEHIFRVLKCQFGYRKTRYRGREKNAAQMFMLMGLTNLYLVRGQVKMATNYRTDRTLVLSARSPR